MNTDPKGQPAAEIQLPIEGMTCGSCVNRIERFLRSTDGVEEANVNLATEMATIRYLPDVADRDRLVAAVEAAGYDVREPALSVAHPECRRQMVLHLRPATRAFDHLLPLARIRRRRSTTRSTASVGEFARY